MKKKRFSQKAFETFSQYNFGPKLEMFVKFINSTSFILGIITAIGAFMRLLGVNHSLWTDELTSAWVINDGMGQILHRFWLNNCPPLSYYFFGGFTAILGNSEWSIRLPSVFSGILSIPFMFILAKRITRHRAVGITTALFMAIDPRFIWLSQDARPYSLLVLVGILQVYFFYSLLQTNKNSHRLGFVITSIAMIYLHYTAALMLLAQFIFFGLKKYRNHKSLSYSFRMYLIDLAIVLIACLPLKNSLIYVISNSHNLSISTDRVDIYSILLVFNIGVYIIYPMLICIIIDYGVGKKVIPVSKPALVDQEIMIFIISLFIIPVGISWAFSYTGIINVFVSRYLILSSLLLVIGSSLACNWFRQFFVRIMFVGIIVVIFITQGFKNFGQSGTFSSHYNSDWRGAVSYLNTILDNSNKPILVYSGLVESDRTEARAGNNLLVSYLLASVNSFYRLNSDNSSLIPLGYSKPSNLPVPVVDLIRASGGAYLIGPLSKEFVTLLSQEFIKEGILSYIVNIKEFKKVIVSELKIGHVNLSSQFKNHHKLP